MHLRRPSAALLLILLILTMGLVAGCGSGGGKQSGNGSQDKAFGGAKKQGDGDAKQGGQRRSGIKIALGTVANVDAEKRRITLRPSTDEQGEKPILFKVKPKATITLDNEKAELADGKKGQQAQITYIFRTDLDHNVARQVALFSSSRAGSRGGKETD